MSTVGIAQADTADSLQKIIQDYVQDNLPTQTVLLDQLKRNDNVEEFNGTFFAPIRSSRHTGVANLANDRNKLATGAAAKDQASVSVRTVTATFDISDLAIKATQGKKKAVVNEATFQTTAMTDDVGKHINRQFFGDGYGVIAEVVGSTSGTQFTIAHPTASNDDARSTWYGSVNGDIEPARYLIGGTSGQYIAVGSGGAGTTRIAAIDATGTIVTTLSSVASVANDAIYLTDGEGAGAGTSEIQGVRLALSSGTADYAGVPRSVPSFAPQVDVTSEALSFTKMLRLYTKARRFAQKGDRYAWFMNTTLYVKYGEILTSMRQTVNETSLIGGWSGLEFQAGGGKIAVFMDDDVPDGEAILLNLDTWTVCQVADMGPPALDGGKLQRRTDYLTGQQVMVWYANLLNVAPAANVRLARKTG